MKLLNRFVKTVFALACLGSSAAFSEDVDIFLTNATAIETRPNVLLVLDNAAANNSQITDLLWDRSSTKLEMLRQVLDVLVNPKESKYFPPCYVIGEFRFPINCVTRDEGDKLIRNINLGLMIMNPQGVGSKQGGYVRYHIRSMADNGNRQTFLSKINYGSPPAIPQANNAPYAKSLHEAYLYFGGKPAYVGFASGEYNASTGNGYDPAARSGADYVSPATDNCQGNFIIFVGNGGPDSGEDTDTRKLLNGISGILSSDPIRFSPSLFQSNWSDEYTRTLKSQDVVPQLEGKQSITTYTIAVQNPEDNNYKTAPMGSARSLLQSMAIQGGGDYYLAGNGRAVLNAFYDALRKMQPVNSVFAAVTLPVSVNVRGTFLNQVYMGQFRPDADAHPRWPGNLKLYQVGLDAAGNPQLADRFAAAAEDKVNGFLLPTVTSFWTTGSSYWSFDTSIARSDAPDGAYVEKGGVAQRLRSTYGSSQDGRKLYTCNGSCGTSGTALSSFAFSDSNTTGITADGLGVGGGSDRSDLVAWVRGADNKEDENKDGSQSDIRARVHGDLLHSRPAVVNYNRSEGNRDIVVYYGANDGLFRAVKGGLDNEDGVEKWGVVFPEFLGQLKRLRDNSPDISESSRKPYFADGTVSVYQQDVNNDGKLVAADGDKVYLYISMRRGGRFVYALDVSDPDVPKFLWKIDTATAGFTELGQSWSAVRPTNIKAVSGDPAVIFGAGYDGNAEDPLPATANGMGRGIFVANGRTGAPVAYIGPSAASVPSGIPRVSADMASVPADLTVVDRDGDGKADRIYAADTKGNVWRVDINDADPSKWVAHKIAALGGTGGDARKFLNKPDVVFGETYDAVLVGSGDREHPFETSVVDRFYMLRDSFTGLAGGLFCGSAGVPATSCTHEDLADVTLNPYQSTPLPVNYKGWYLTLAAGEKVVGNPITVFGTTFFGTNRPTPPKPGICTANLGEARLYRIGFETGNARQDLNADGTLATEDRSETMAGGGFPPSPVYSPVTIKGKTVDVVCVGPKCFNPGGAGFDTRRRRIYWYTK